MGSTLNTALYAPSHPHLIRFMRIPKPCIFLNCLPEMDSTVSLSWACVFIIGSFLLVIHSSLEIPCVVVLVSSSRRSQIEVLVQPVSFFFESGVSGLLKSDRIKHLHPCDQPWDLHSLSSLQLAVYREAALFNTTCLCSCPTHPGLYYSGLLAKPMYSILTVSDAGIKGDVLRKCFALSSSTPA